MEGRVILTSGLLGALVTGSFVITSAGHPAHVAVMITVIVTQVLYEGSLVNH